MEGWIKLHRKILDWEWYSDTNTKVVFLHLLLSANHEDKKWRGIVIGKGQILTSQNILSDTLGLSRHAIRIALDHLQMTNEITIKATKRHSVVTINNYACYQMIEDEQRPTERPTERPTDGQVTANRRPSNGQASHKNDKNIKNEKKEINIDNPFIISPKSEKFSMKKQLMEDGLQEKLIDAYMLVRKSKKAPDSEIAYKGLIREAEKAGISIETAITECVERNWVGFKADWYNRDRKKKSFQQQLEFVYDPETEKELKRRKAERKEQEEREIEEARKRDIQRIEDIIHHRQ